MSGLKVDVEPVIEFWLFAVEPVIDDCEPAVDPETAALLSAAVEALVLVEGFVVLVEGFVAFAVLGAVVVVPVALAWLSGMQSMWTGLCECSFAMPVSLSASLPACGWPSVLHSGFEVAEVAAAVFVALLVALLVVCASAGVALSTAAATRLRVNENGFMKFLLRGKTETCPFGTGDIGRCCACSEHSGMG